MAYYLHQCSSRRDKPFLVLNCSAVPADMIEAELFGDTHHAGKLMLADGGTLFLDEVEELPLPAQSRLLYYSQPDRETGNPDPSARLPNTRIIASTSRPLEAMVEERRFRRELFFRLNTITITMPPLRDRRHSRPAERFPTGTGGVPGRMRWVSGREKCPWQAPEA